MTYPFTDIGISGSLTDLQNDSGGAVTAQVTGGDQPASVENLGASTTTVSGSVTVTITVTDLDGNVLEGINVRVEEDTAKPRTLISNGATNGSGVYSFSFTDTTPQAVRIVVRLKGWEAELKLGTIESGDGLATSFTLTPDTKVNLP